MSQAWLSNLLAVPTCISPGAPSIGRTWSTMAGPSAAPGSRHTRTNVSGRAQPSTMHSPGAGSSGSDTSSSTAPNPSSGVSTSHDRRAAGGTRPGGLPSRLASVIRARFPFGASHRRTPLAPPSASKTSSGTVPTATWMRDSPSNETRSSLTSHDPSRSAAEATSADGEPASRATSRKARSVSSGSAHPATRTSSAGPPPVPASASLSARGVSGSGSTRQMHSVLPSARTNGHWASSLDHGRVAVAVAGSSSARPLTRIGMGCAGSSPSSVTSGCVLFGVGGRSVTSGQRVGWGVTRAVSGRDVRFAASQPATSTPTTPRSSRPRRLDSRSMRPAAR